MMDITVLMKEWIILITIGVQQVSIAIEAMNRKNQSSTLNMQLENYLIQ